MNKLIITKWATINNTEAICNGEQKYAFHAEEEAEQKLEQLYRSLNVAYPKFFKMDAQSKLGWLCAEYACQGRAESDVQSQDIALVLSNHKSSLDTDEHYVESLAAEAEFLPSPAVFVYTLANIVAGEICIRHGFKGENNFFISERFNATLLFNYANLLFEEALCKQCLVGWVEAYHGELRAVFAFVESSTDGSSDRLFTIENLNQLYQISAS